MKTSAWLWAGVAGVFVLMGCAWTAMFFFAGRAHVESVPLVPEGRAVPPGPPPPQAAAPQTQTGGPGGTALPNTEAR